jgi:UDPglucose--hexose-1-phosphate uridylyltransferase
MAIALRDVLFMLTKTLNEPDYNVVFHNAPTSDKLREHYQWWIEVIPRISVLGGFELGSGIYVNTVEPVVAAKTLADAI